MLTFLLWCILFVLCWPLAILALVLYPIVWLILLPFRLLGFAVEGALRLVWAISRCRSRSYGGWRRSANPPFAVCDTLVAFAWKH